MNLHPYRVGITDDAIADLHSRLDRTRWPDEINNADGSWGTGLSWLQELIGYWRNGLEWREQEARLNMLPFSKPASRTFHTTAKEWRKRELAGRKAAGWPTGKR